MISALLTACMALVAPDLKRALAYSTVSQLGYMVYAIGVGGIFASQFHLFSHAIFKALLFLAAGAVIHAVGTRDMRKMGGLGKQMPFVRTVFVLGALALAGTADLQRLLEQGAGAGGGTHRRADLGPGRDADRRGAHGLLHVPHGLDGLLRRGAQPPARPRRHAGDAVSLGLLAVGTLTTWLAAGRSSICWNHAAATTSCTPSAWASSTHEILAAPVTWIALGVVGLGLLAWVGRDRLTFLTDGFGWLGVAASKSFGFERINEQVVAVTQATANALRVTQPGHLSWNLVGIIGGLVAVLILLTWGA